MRETNDEAPSMFEQLINAEIPDVFYHYTNAAGMMGIVDNKEIWCTHTQYLNDTQEFKHALSLFCTQIERRLASDEKNSDFLKKVYDFAVSEVEDTNVCVASFSTEKDSLSQWRAYANAPGGYALGFSGIKLKQIVDEAGLSIHPCEYDESKQVGIINELLDHMLEMKEKDIEYAAVMIWATCPILKHKSFKSEREWRIITMPVSNRNPRFSFRTGISMLVPYYKMDLRVGDEPLAINKVIIGPTPHPRQSLNSTQSFFDSRGLHPEIQNSSVPFRSW